MSVNKHPRCVVLRQGYSGRLIHAAVAALGLGVGAVGCMADSGSEPKQLAGSLAQNIEATPIEGSAAATQPRRVEPVVLAKLEVGENHTVEFREVIPGVLMTSETYKLGEAEPVVPLKVRSMASVYRDLAGDRVDGPALEALEAAEGRAESRRQFIAQVQADRSPAERRERERERERIAASAPTRPEQVAGFAPSSDPELIEKSSCSFNMSHHNDLVTAFHNLFCIPGQVTECWAVHDGRFMFLDHFDISHPRNIRITGANLQKCNDADFDTFFQTPCGTWDPCSHGFIFQDKVSPGFAVTHTVGMDDASIQPNIFGSGNNSDKDVVLSYHKQ